MSRKKHKASVKSERELSLMRDAGRIVAETFRAVTPYVKTGVNLRELDARAAEYIVSTGAKPSFKGLYGFPDNICFAVNEEIVHGRARNYALQSGDLVTLDIGVAHKGYHGDAARTYRVGAVSAEADRLVTTVQRAMEAGTEATRSGHRLWQVAQAIYNVIKSQGYGVVDNYGGHGIGRFPHEDPFVHNVVDERHPDHNFLLRPGIVLAIEPMATLGSAQNQALKDWNLGTVVTTSRKLSAHWEETVAVTLNGPEVLTRTAEGTDGLEALAAG